MLFPLKDSFVKLNGLYIVSDYQASFVSQLLYSHAIMPQIKLRDSVKIMTLGSSFFNTDLNPNNSSICRDWKNALPIE